MRAHAPAAMTVVEPKAARNGARLISSAAICSSPSASSLSFSLLISSKRGSIMCLVGKSQLGFERERGSDAHVSEVELRKL